MTVGEYSYAYEYEGFPQTEGEATGGTNNTIASETLTRWKPKDGKAKQIVKRNSSSFVFLNKTLPKLPRETPSIYLLKEESDIAPLHTLFSRIQRRKFHDAALRDASAYQNLPQDLVDRVSKNRCLEQLFHPEQHTLSAKLSLMKQFFTAQYEIAGQSLKEVFPTIEKFDVQVLDAPKLRGLNVDIRGDIPVFVIKERGVKKWLRLPDLSSGMQKVLLITTDILTLPAGGIYIIDEYENSLGVNAIDFLPKFLSEHGQNRQFFITTHHPYLINNMPVKAWRVFHRKGQVVSIRPGEEFAERFGRSKQKAFIQLINDPFYIEGNE